MLDIWFWQLIVSPHMAHLAVALVRLGCKVTYVVERTMTADRTDQGWIAPELPGVKLVCATGSEAVRRLVDSATPNSIHVCQGVRANDIVAVAQSMLAARGLRQWVVMETVEDSGWRGVVKRFEYGRLFRARRGILQGVLAIGYRTADWVVARGVPPDCVYPFGYFLPNDEVDAGAGRGKPEPFRFLFAGRLIPLKRVDWLIEAIAKLSDKNCELWIVGTGAEEPALRLLATRRLGDRIRWLGRLSLSEVPAVMAQADCLVLPSVHDGWGAVISEALMVGTPVICSDTCGAAGVVHGSGFGGVFPHNDSDELQARLDEQIRFGPIRASDRVRLSSWATALSADAGARYMISIFNYAANRGSRPLPPWHDGRI